MTVGFREKFPEMEATRRKIFYAAHVFAAQHEANAPAVDAAQTNYAFDLILT